MKRPTNLDIRNASITKPTTMGINKATIFKAENGGEVINMTRSIMVNPETGE
jgi:hypothetical protein